MENIENFEENQTEDATTFEEGLNPQPSQDGDYGGIPVSNKSGESYASGIMQLMYDNKTKVDIQNMLKQSSPEEGIKHVTLVLVDHMNEALNKAGKPPSFEDIANGAIFTIQEVANLGNEAGFFKVGQKDLPVLLEDVLKTIVSNGLADGSLDPIELQQQAESLMSPEDRQKFTQIGKENGFSEKPGQMQAMEVYANEAVRKEKDKNPVGGPR